jgi:osmotically-inducible protein OsmY
MKRLAPALLLALLVSGCPNPTPIQQAGSDQEITREIQWAFREDPRFSEVQVLCLDRVVTLKGRVDDIPAEREAIRIARSRGRGAKVVSQLEARPR